ncbi:MAG: sigma 54-interacting transcriptional regulator [Silvibacterium sp.]
MTVRRALQHVRLQREVERLRNRKPEALTADEEREQEHHLVGSSRGMLEVFKAIGRVAKADVAVLLLGETGTGKKLVALTIHESGTTACFRAWSQSWR